MPTFELHCAHAEAVAIEIENLAKQLQRGAHAMKKAAHEGSPGKIRLAAEKIDEAARKTREIEATARRAWPLSDHELTELLNGPYVDELIETAAAAGVPLTRLEGCLAAFPVVLRVLPDKRALRLDTIQLTTLRPAAVTERIRAKMKKQSNRPEKFIEVLFNAYQLVMGSQGESGTTLVKIYDALTMLPGTGSAYGRAEFARDVYVLDASDVRKTRSGATLSFPAATGTRTKSDTLSIITPHGMPKYYYGLRFE